ncbi:TSUP family transporter [Spirilliplanes yamanashiensis]|uniref:Probable membrane transporter protein n=1 Tax=Spirilliplanes yamanashiensis TaxID=42233 RepID=A0A8J3Y3H9_9ACTN|nr:TSUP family transporter [Spirilliplanes yamanashiensis]MDP9820184.1 putative membrane protein YfcA [Spirilliplanes yamanashiensis]GIJ00996.1 hypothetical protein Sya03_03480 [Spirilliplanes yamanashiensis]
MSPLDLLAAAALGAAAAAVGTPAGVSGGLLLLPALLTVYGLGGTVASATNLLFNIVSTPAGIARTRHLDRALAVTLTAAAVPGAVAGAVLNVAVAGDTRAFRVLVAGLLVAVALSLLLPRPAAGQARVARPGPWLTVAGLLSGVLGGFFGLGGAVLAAPAALLLTGRPVHRVAGAALATTLAVSVTGLAAYTVMDLAGLTRVQTPHWPLGLALGAGGLLGAAFAARLAPRLPDRLLRGGLALLVAGAATRLALVV